MSESSASASIGRSPPPQEPPSLIRVFIAFCTISLSGFGGVLAWSRRILVEERKWMTPAEFSDAYALCQFLPGPNVVNLSVVFGRSIRGVPGAIVALVGLIGPGVAIVTFIGFLYARYGDIAALQRMLTGVAAAAAGLVISVTGKMAQPLLSERDPAGMVAAVAAFFAVGIMHWPIYWVLAVLIPLSIGLVWRSKR